MKFSIFLLIIFAFHPRYGKCQSAVHFGTYRASNCCLADTSDAELVLKRDTFALTFFMIDKLTGNYSKVYRGKWHYSNDKDFKMSGAYFMVLYKNNYDQLIKYSVHFASDMADIIELDFDDGTKRTGYITAGKTHRYNLYLSLNGIYGKMFQEVQ